eukprot:2321942-Amphidinium_carterae.1
MNGAAEKDPFDNSYPKKPKSGKPNASALRAVMPKVFAGLNVRVSVEQYAVSTGSWRSLIQPQASLQTNIIDKDSHPTASKSANKHHRQGRPLEHKSEYNIEEQAMGGTWDLLWFGVCGVAKTCIATGSTSNQQLHNCSLAKYSLHRSPH